MPHIGRTLAAIFLLFKGIPVALPTPIQDPRLSGYTGLDSSGGSTPSTGSGTNAATVVEPDDFSAIKTIATIGDSYAAGIGAGLRTDWKCSRYDHSYPALLSTYDGLENATFQFLACSGALSTDILKNQVPAINGIVDAMTVSAGGNDVGLVNILNDCIFGWKIVGYSSDGCDRTLANTQSLIDNELPGALDNLLTAAKAKLTPTTGRIYYTAYAQFFGSSSQCDSVYWNFWPLDPYAQALTADRRNQMNTLATNVNKAIQAAVTRAGSQVIYVDYDPYYTDFDGRFCEPDVTEPAPDRDDLLFFQKKTTNAALGWKKKRAVSNGTTLAANTAADTAAAADPDNIIANGTFEGSIAAMISNTLITNPSWITALDSSVFEVLEVDTPPADGSAPHIISASAPTSDITSARFRRGSVGDFAAWLVTDSVKRVFHPRPRGHSLMASLVLYHMEAENAIMNPAPAYANNATTVWTELPPALALSCPLQAADIPIANADALVGAGGTSTVSITPQSTPIQSPVSAPTSYVTLQPVVAPPDGAATS